MPKIGDAGETSVIHSQSSPYGALFLISNKRNLLIDQSLVWEYYNNVVFDNIETKILSSTGDVKNEKLMKIILYI